MAAINGTAATGMVTTETATVESAKIGDEIGTGRRNKSPYRLFVGNLPKAKTERDICEELGRNTPGLVRVITYKNFEDPKLHRGFCFLDYESQTAAEEAKSWLTRYTTFGCRTIVDWADPEPEFDDCTMATVRILFVRQYGGMLSEEVIARVFGRYGTVERVKNLKNYSFVHFARREDAQAAMDALDGAKDEDSGVNIDVLWAKPPADRQHRERMLRNREWRMKLATSGRHLFTTDVPRVTKASDRVSATNQADSDPYSTYEHYSYDFSRQTLDCQLQQQLDVPSRNPFYCKPATTNDLRNKSNDHDQRRNRTVDLHEGGDERRPRDSQPFDLDDRHGDRGDCELPIQSCDDLDTNILRFFYKVINGGTATTK